MCSSILRLLMINHFSNVMQLLHLLTRFGSFLLSGGVAGPGKSALQVNRWGASKL